MERLTDYHNKNNVPWGPPKEGARGFYFKKNYKLDNAVVSQLVENEFSKLDVAGSIPVYRSILCLDRSTDRTTAF